MFAQKAQLRVHCVIVTFNRKKMLRDAIGAVTRQTRKPDLIIVVDNKSTDGTREWLSNFASTREDTVLCFMDENTGGAGGFHHGIKMACELGADWVWTMDDDCMPAPHALENLLNCGVIGPEGCGGDVGFVASRVNWRDGSRHKMNVPGWLGEPKANWWGCDELPRVGYASFVSIVINVKALERVGLPIKELFIYCDDLEFTSRITNAGFRGYLVEASTVLHLTKSNEGLSLDALDIKPENLARCKYFVRNVVAVNRRRKYGWFRESAWIGYLLVRLIGKAVPVAIIVVLVAAGVRGLCLDYEKWIEYPSCSANTPLVDGLK